ncbi:hypothetical protein HK102_005117 [Quaeritorhiza haematococci]|nr:hypothetical protein HK102_005117 [Quaeritorhiza haematococci]
MIPRQFLLLATTVLVLAALLAPLNHALTIERRVDTAPNADPTTTATMDAHCSIDRKSAGRALFERLKSVSNTLVQNIQGKVISIINAGTGGNKTDADVALKNLRLVLRERAERFEKANANSDGIEKNSMADGKKFLESLATPPSSSPTAPTSTEHALIARQHTRQQEILEMILTVISQVFHIGLAFTPWVVPVLIVTYVLECVIDGIRYIMELGPDPGTRCTPVWFTLGAIVDVYDRIVNAIFPPQHRNSTLG